MGSITSNNDHFDGKTYEAKHDHGRLSSQLARVRDVMRDGRWRTLEEIEKAIPGASTAAISARLRDLRKTRFGGHVVNRRRRDNAARGIYEYQLFVVRKAD